MNQMRMALRRAPVSSQRSARLVHMLRPLSSSRRIGGGKANALAGFSAGGVTTGPRRHNLSAPARGMATIDYILTDIGEGIAEVEVIKWHIKEGDTISQFDAVCEVQSDKATVDIPSRYDGKVTELLHAPGDMVATGSALIRMEVDDDVANDQGGKKKGKRAKKAAAKKAEAEAAVAQAAPAGTSSGKVLTSPAVRHIARQHSIDLAMVAGTGPKGRIVKEDVLAFINNGGAAAAAAAPAVDAAAPVASGGAPVTAATPPAYSKEDREVPVTGLARIMVKTMEAANQVPCFGYGDEICMDNLIALRTACKPMAEARGVKLSFFPFILKATSLALQQFPMMNAHVNEDCTSVTWKGSHNIGFAMDTPRGLLVPNIKNVQDKSVLEIAEELNRLMALGNEGRLGQTDLTGGTFTLSNIGAIGGTYMSPILVLPEVCIGALGKFQTLPRFDENGAVKKSTVMNVSWSADHRVLDGATGARFSNVWKSYLENPGTMVLG